MAVASLTQKKSFITPSLVRQPVETGFEPVTVSVTSNRAPTATTTTESGGKIIKHFSFVADAMNKLERLFIASLFSHV